MGILCKCFICRFFKHKVQQFHKTILCSTFVSPQVEGIDDLLKDSDSEMEDDSKSPAAADKKQKGKAGQAWLREGGEEEIVDFLDASVSKKVLGKFYVI